MDQATRQETREAQTGLLAEHKVLKNKLWKLTGLVGRGYRRENEPRRGKQGLVLQMAHGQGGGYNTST